MTRIKPPGAPAEQTPMPAQEQVEGNDGKAWADTLTAALTPGWKPGREVTQAEVDMGRPATRRG